MALASGLLVPWEPERVYSFMPGYTLLLRGNVEFLAECNEPVRVEDSREFGDDDDWVVARGIGLLDAKPFDPVVAAHALHDLRESARVYSIPLEFA